MWSWNHMEPFFVPLVNIIYMRMFLALSLWEVDSCYEVGFLLCSVSYGYKFFLWNWRENRKKSALLFSEEGVLSASILTNGLASWSIPHVIALDCKYIIITADATIHWVGVDESTETSRTQSWGRYITSPRRLITVMGKWRWLGLLDKQPLLALQTVRHSWAK